MLRAIIAIEFLEQMCFLQLRNTNVDFDRENDSSVFIRSHTSAWRMLFVNILMSLPSLFSYKDFLMRIRREKVKLHINLRNNC